MAGRAVTVMPISELCEISVFGLSSGEREVRTVDSRFTWIFKPEAGGTQVDVHVEYTVPVPVIGKLAERLIIKQNEREADTLLVNLKAVMEA